MVTQKESKRRVQSIATDKVLETSVIKQFNITCSSMVETAETGKRFGMPAKQLVQAIYRRRRRKKILCHQTIKRYKTHIALKCCKCYPTMQGKPPQ